MSAKPQPKLFMKLVSVVLVWLYLQLLLWSTLLRPAIAVDVQWVPKSFFSSTKQSTCIIRLHHTPPMRMLFESAFFATIALLGYFPGRGSGLGLAGVDPYGIYGGTLPNFEKSMMGVRQKYHWICFVPWIIAFLRNWLQNFGELLLVFGGGAVGGDSDAAASMYEAQNFYSTMAVLMLYFSLQALLASEVVCLAWQGSCAMRNINDENMLWEQRKRILVGDGLNTFEYGTMH